MASVYSVSQVTAYIKNMFTQDFALNRISIRGEVSNCKYHTSGHIYFTLKDGGAQIAAVMFAGQRKGLSFTLAEGQQVTATGSVDVYERDGRYQLYVRKIERDGTGDLYARFERLKAELLEMGMFDACYKQPIPRFALRVGVVTASTGAAIRDIMNISARRNPYVQLVLCPAQVQGERAAASIVRGIETLDAMGLDVLIVGRGGGSIEDLWAFNEERVARAIFNCRTPVISAGGHETDVTIADYVADLRAPTPSAAAELAVFDWHQFEEQLASERKRLDRLMQLSLEKRKGQLARSRMQLALYSPQRQVNEMRQRLADIEGRLTENARGRILRDRQALTAGRELLVRAMERSFTGARHRLAVDAGRLDGLSPLKRLRGGYGYVTDRTGRPVRSAALTEPGSRIQVQLADGRLKALVEEVFVEKGRDSYAQEEDGGSAGS